MANLHVTFADTDSLIMSSSSCKNMNKHYFIVILQTVLTRDVQNKFNVDSSIV